MADERKHADYRRWLLSQPCCCQPCVSSVVIHHHTSGETEPHAKSMGGRRGKSQRASDDQGMPLCFRHHGNLHELRGFFADYDKHSLRTWQDDQVARLQRLFAMAHPEPLDHLHADQAAGKKRKTAATGTADAERARIVRVILARAAERHHLPDQHQLLSELAADIAGGLNDTGSF